MSLVKSIQKQKPCARCGLKLFSLFSFILFFDHPAFATQFTSISLGPATVGIYQKYEITCQLNRSYTNPFDPEEIDITAIFTQPDSSTVIVPAFYYQDFERSLVDSSEKLTPINSPVWKVRFAACQLGGYVVRLRVVDRDGDLLSDQYRFTAVASSSKGFVHIDPGNKRFLRFDDSSPYLPVGQNIGWAMAGGTYDYDRWLEQMHINHANWLRIWCTHFYHGQSLEWSSSHPSGQYRGYGKYNLAAAWRWDYLVQQAEENGFYIQMVTQHHGQFSVTTNPNWNENPYNVVNGGFLTSPDQFFTNDLAKKLYKQKMRYTIARWGYSTAILTWELWNEVHFTTKYYFGNYPNVVAWHREMGAYLKQADPWHHLVTTSAQDGDRELWNAPELDMVEIHYYGPDVTQYVQQRILQLWEHNKPVFMGEFGVDTFLQSSDLTGILLHNGIWTASIIGAAAMPWGWDNYVHPLHLYYHFYALQRFWQGEDPAVDNPSPRSLQISGGPRSPGGLTISLGLGWESSQQQEFFIQADGTAPGIEKLSRYIQGSRKLQMGREGIFNIHYAHAGKFLVNIAGVSAIQPIICQIFIDDMNTPVLQDTVTDKITYSVPVTAGSHRLRVYNAGVDWFEVSSCQFTGFVIQATRGYCLSNGSTAYLWIQDRNHDCGDRDNGTITGVQVALDFLPAGNYSIEFWDTYRGERISTKSVTTSGDSLAFVVPDFSGDIAVKIKPQTPVGNRRQ